MSENLEKSEELELQNKLLTKLGQENLDRLACVEVSLMAELGATRIPLKSVLEFDGGTIVKLDKKNEDPVHIYVDNVMIAKGEIVAVNKSFGIKITEIIEKNLV